MTKLPAFQFYPGDWLRDVGVQAASFETRGFWIELMIRMWDAPERGKLCVTHKELQQLLGCNSSAEKRNLLALKKLGIADVTNRNGRITIINRRMYKDEIKRQKTRERVKEFREKQA